MGHGRGAGRARPTLAELVFKLIEHAGGSMDYVPVSQKMLRRVPLPEYLGQEIEFDKAQLSLFYDQVVEALSRQENAP